MAEDERDRAGPEQGRERRDRKSTLRRKKKKRDRSGTRDRGNKPDGEFEGDGVNGDRRRMDGEEAGRQAGRQGKRGWLTKGTEAGQRSGAGEAIGVEKFNCAYFRSDVSQILRPSPRVHPPSLPRLRHSPPLLSPCFRATVRLRLYPSSFILRPQERWKTGDMHMAVSFLPPPFARPGYLIRAVLAAPRYSRPSSP